MKHTWNFIGPYLNRVGVWVARAETTDGRWTVGAQGGDRASALARLKAEVTDFDTRFDGEAP